MSAFRITVEAVNADPGNEDASYIADHATFEVTVEASNSIDALRVVDDYI